MSCEILQSCDKLGSLRLFPTTGEHISLYWAILLYMLRCPVGGSTVPVGAFMVKHNNINIKFGIK